MATIALILLLLTPAARAEAPARLPAGFLPVPLTAQATSYSCGPAALLSVLHYWGADAGPSESALYAPLEAIPGQGTEPGKLAEVAKARGLDAEFKRGLELPDLRAALKRGDTAILDLQAWRDPFSTKTWTNEWEKGHYVVLVAMDAKDAFVMDPLVLGSYAWLPLTELLERWHDYEDRHGPVERNLHAAVLVRGKKASGSAAPSAVRMR